MNVIFTICANNYLAQASVLGTSLKKHERATKFIIVLCDTKQPAIDYSQLADEVIAVADIEPAADTMALKYNIIELSTCVKPRVIEYLFNDRGASKVLYIDPDIKVFQPLNFLFTLLDTASVLLTPHICTPIPIDQQKPGENTFLNFGIYNLGFIGLCNNGETKRLVQWWKEHTYSQGYIDYEHGIFVDQLPMNHVPIFFKNVAVLLNKGLNMAPWNLHERAITAKDGVYWVNGEVELAFYHFSSFGVDTNELPLIHYDRIKLADRPDLQGVYQEYNSDLKAANYAFYQPFISHYATIYNNNLDEIFRHEWAKKPLLKRMFKKMGKITTDRRQINQLLGHPQYF